MKKTIDKLINSDGKCPFCDWQSRAKSPRRGLVSHLKRMHKDRIALEVPISAANYLGILSGIQGNMVTRINAVLDTLDFRESRIVRLRFGLEDGRRKTLEEVGREFGVTRERIRQIEAKAFRKLRHPTRTKMLYTPVFSDD